MTAQTAEIGSDPLSGITLLSGMDPAARERLARQCRWKRYGTHEQILDRQSEGTEVCFVAEGAVRIVIYSLSGREVTLEDVPAGGFFGELAAIDGKPRSASVMAIDQAMVAALPGDDFRRLLEAQPKIAMQVMYRLAQMVRQSTGRIMDLSTLAANNRVQAELLRLAKLGEEGDSAVISPIPIHADIAGRVSTTRETVARVMNDLARQGVVKREKGALRILDVERLEGMVEEIRGE
ncbi:MAG: Crp/Fnr family transcriptional regulator [Acetobacterales bacterium]